MEKKWESIRNGSDIRGVVIPNDDLAVNLTDEMIQAIARSFVVYVSKLVNKKYEQLTIAVGHDSRLTSEHIKQLFTTEVARLGCRVLDCGLASTPAMFMSTQFTESQADGAVEITASHMPYIYNGLKFFTCRGGFESTDIKELLQLASQAKLPTINEKGTVRSFPLMDYYSNHLITIIRKGINDEVDYDKPLNGLKIIVDAGNGVGGFFASQILSQLGADTEGSQFLDPDGRFPNHIPNPENEEAMISIQQATIKHQADLGIIFDTDVDRSAIVDGKGNKINRNFIIALASQIVLEEHPNTVIVTDSITSNGLTTFIESLGGTHHRFKRGYRNVINEAIRLNKEGQECHLAIEISGHAALKENYFLDDGAYLVAKILIKMRQLNKQGLQLSDLIKDLEVPKEDVEYRFMIHDPDFKTYGKKSNF